MSPFITTMRSITFQLPSIKYLLICDANKILQITEALLKQLDNCTVTSWWQHGKDNVLIVPC